VIRFVPRSQLVITIPSETAMAATKKAMLRRKAAAMMKPWEVKKAEKRKAERQKAQDAITSALRNEWMKISLETKTMYGYRVKNADVCFYYGKKPCTNTPDTLEMIVRLFALLVVESGADQVTVNHKERKHRRTRKSGPNEEHVSALERMLERCRSRDRQQKNKARMM
jgi:hypothetical protein